MRNRETLTEDLEIAATGVPGEFMMKGNLTILHAAELRKGLLDILGRHDAVVLHIDAHAETDLSFLQLLCSACRTALKRGKSLAVRNDVPDSYRSLLDEAGYSRQQGCALDAKHGCLWIPGSGQ